MKIDSQFLVSCVLAGSLLGLPAIAAPQEQENNTGDSVISVALADNGGEHGRREHERFTDEQLEKMSSLKNQFEQAITMQKAQLHVLRLQMQELMLKPSADRSQVLSLQSKINGLHDDINIKAMTYRLDKMDILTPAQREEMRHRMLMHCAFGGGFHGHGGHHGGHGYGGHGHWQGGGEHGPSEHGKWEGHHNEEHKDGPEAHNS